ncbi:MAG: hypothetical protein LBD80_06690 [Tannerella sp.]|jgi:hypothetical protein|nr:hypothetical protein [Tannerella sp.]
MNCSFKHKTARQYKKHFFWATSVFIAASLASCDNMTDNYKKYLEGGEIIYPGKADLVTAHPGKNRIELEWLLKSDPSVTSAIIYWSNKEKYKEVPVSRTSDVDTIKVMLENMDEQTYTFEIYTFDRLGNKSVVSEVTGAVYGDKYRSTLMNRAIRELNITDDGNLNISWETADEGTRAEELTYTDMNGITCTAIFDVSEQTVRLENFNPDQTLRIATVFTPDSAAIDTFKAAGELIDFDVFETIAEVDRSKFSLINLPGDKNEPNSANNAIQQIWTNTYSCDGTPYISKAWAITACNDLWPFPYWFTIDLGDLYNLSSLTLWQRGGNNQLYANNNPRLFEIWGAAETDITYNPAEHGNVFDNNWILLESCRITPPDDPALYTSTAAAGHEFDLRINGKTKKIRYIRFKILDNWLADSGSCPLVKKRTYINIASIRLDAIQKIIQLKF